MTRASLPLHGALVTELCNAAAEGVPVSPINSYSEALADPHVAAAGWARPLTPPNGAETRTFAPPLRLDGVPIPLRSGPSTLDADRVSTLAALEQRSRSLQEVGHD